MKATWNLAAQTPGGFLHGVNHEVRLCARREEAPPSARWFTGIPLSGWDWPSRCQSPRTCAAQARYATSARLGAPGGVRPLQRRWEVAVSIQIAHALREVRERLTFATRERRRPVAASQRAGRCVFPRRGPPRPARAPQSRRRPAPARAVDGRVNQVAARRTRLRRDDDEASARRLRVNQVAARRLVIVSLRAHQHPGRRRKGRIEQRRQRARCRTGWTVQGTTPRGSVGAGRHAGTRRGRRVDGPLARRR